MKLSKSLFIIIFLITLQFLESKANLFYSIDWQFVKERKGITLYMSKDKDTNINYYKASIILSFDRADKNNFNKIIELLLDFNSYSKVFPKTLLFEPIKIIDDNKFIIHSILNFFPYKNREYLVELAINQEVIDGKRVFRMFWYPIDSDIPEYSTIIKNFNFNKKNHIIKNVYGMWLIEEIGDGQIKITFFSFNDWEINAPFNLKIEFEKDGTINNIIDLLNKIY